MTVRDVDALLKRAVKETLVELTREHQNMVVNFHIACLSRLEYCSGSDVEGEEQEAHFVEQIVWRLNLYITHKGRYTALNGALPYSYCFDGDSGPMVELLKRMWEQYTFSHLMLDQDLDQELEQVAAEVEGS